MFIYNVRELLLDPKLSIPIQETFEVETLEFGAVAYPVVKQPEVRAVIRNLDGTILDLTGTVDACILMPCSRCMEEVQVPLHIEIAQHFIQKESAEGLDESEDVELFSGFLLDLTEFLQNELLLSIPMKVLCKEDCLGLCPNCGKNLNQGPCSCDLHEDHPAWDALKGLLQGKK